MTSLRCFEDALVDFVLLSNALMVLKMIYKIFLAMFTQ